MMPHQTKSRIMWVGNLERGSRILRTSYRVLGCVFLVSFLLFAASSLTETTISEEKEAAVSVVRPDVLLSHAPLVIDGDSDLALYSTSGGSGIVSDPYVIANLSIGYDGLNDHCIEISNTRAYFLIANCTLTGAINGAGLLLTNVTNGELRNNTCSDNLDGLILTLTENTTVVENDCSGNTESGIQILWSSGNNLTLNTCNENWDGIVITYSSNENLLLNNTCADNTIAGFYLDSTCGDSTITWNNLERNFYNAEDDGLGQANVFVWNYWSDYQGIDTGFDRIGDTPHAITGDAGNEDATPLMFPSGRDPIGWDEEPTNQDIDYGELFEYTLALIDYGFFDHWWLSDSDNFSISFSGVLRNKTLLDIDVYLLEIRAYNEYNDYCTSLITINVVDVLPPAWIELPSDQLVELGTGFRYDLNVSDHSDIAMWWINDTGQFTIDEFTGIITNITSPFSLGTYGLQVWVNDTFNNVVTTKLDVRVRDTTPPSWITDPANQFSEFGLAFSYNLDATDLSGIDSWWINDTTNFQISVTGLITNASSLTIGSYPLQVWVSDTQSQVQTAEFIATVHDTTSPIWIELPEDQTLEFGNLFSLQLQASDASGIDHWAISDTINFAITSLGHIFSLESIIIGDFELTVTAFDPFGNSVDTSFTVTVQDTVAPTWVTQPSNQTVELGTAIRYILVASDPSGLEQWSIDDTTDFHIDSSGVLSSVGMLDVGTHTLNISVSDPYGHTTSVVINIFVEDTTPPTWVVVPSNQSLIYGQSLNYDLDASDISGIDEWSLDDTAHFTISEEGVLSFVGVLPVGDYEVRVTVSDTYGNEVSATIIVTIRSAESNPMMLPIAIAGLGGVVLVALVLVHPRGRRMLGRLRRSGT
ncbi:MAG: right-handed parallel beta-helix repeat-containing protein [Candidatus Thorarchaeota archaeon]